eukprot:m.263807 g.263807  ORF g.263807 m.263807 type:complete len:197 (-) comp52409_c0_seq1:177-767(-)
MASIPASIGQLFWDMINVSLAELERSHHDGLTQLQLLQQEPTDQVFHKLRTILTSATDSLNKMQASYDRVDAVLWSTEASTFFDDTLEDCTTADKKNAHAALIFTTLERLLEAHGNDLLSKQIMLIDADTHTPPSTFSTFVTIWNAQVYIPSDLSRLSVSKQFSHLAPPSPAVKTSPKRSPTKINRPPKLRSDDNL